MNYSRIAAGLMLGNPALLVYYDHLMAAALQLVGHRQAHDPGSDDDDVASHCLSSPAIQRSPSTHGRRGSFAGAPSGSVIGKPYFALA